MFTRTKYRTRSLFGDRRRRRGHVADPSMRYRDGSAAVPLRSGWRGPNNRRSESRGIREDKPVALLHQSASFCSRGLRCLNRPHGPNRRIWQRHADAEKTLRGWYMTVPGAEWNSLQDAQETYAHADGVGTARGEMLTVFNISGNKCQLVARVRYDFRLVNIRIALTHAKYDKGNWKV
ncbi:MAG: type II toxin-antitoxin system HigB family toxin [Phycisphaerae bacterium]|nr:type II toxin-antitoxin system HigB family toxin [Phycisphaerae bacterium]